MKKKITAFTSLLKSTQEPSGSKRWVFLIVIFGCMISSTIAQDLIIKKDGSEIEAQVQEVNESSVKYKKFQMQNGPTYVMRRTEIFMIKYHSGDKDVFNEINDIPEPSPNMIEDNESEVVVNGDEKTNAIGVNPFMFFLDLGAKIGTLEYEKKISKQFSVGGRIIRSEQNGYRYWEEAMGAGVFVRRYFRKGGGLSGFYIGSNLDVAAVEWGESWGEGSGWEYEYGKGVAIVLTSQFGGKISIGRSLYVEPSLLLGFYSSNTSSSYDSYHEIGVVAAPLLSVGFRF